MEETIDAIYENGVLRPLKPLPWAIEEHAHVKITLNKDTTQNLAECIGTLPDADAAEMSKIIESEFERLNDNDWK